MSRKNTRLERAVTFTRLSVYLAYCWPPPPDSTKWQNTKFDILWTVSLVSSIALLIPLLLSIYAFQGDTLIVTKSSIFTIAVSNFAIKMIVCRIYRRRTQVVIYEMLDYIKTASPSERAVLESYLDRCSRFHATLTIVFHLSVAIMICGPVILPQPFPTNAVYPFPVTSPLVKFVIYVHQAFAGFQCSTALVLDFQPALLLWFAGARLEILAREAELIENKRNFIDFMRQHQHLLWYAGEIKDIIRYVSLTTAATTGIGTALGLLQLIGTQPLLVKLQFAIVVFSTGINLYACAWPADNLRNVCQSIGTGIYNSPWSRMPVNLIKDYTIVLRRAQKPIVITISGFLPGLSLEYYGSFLSRAFSYFTTLRWTMDIDNA